MASHEFSRANAERDEVESSVVETLMEAANDGIWDWQVQTGAVRFSRRWAEMLGYRLDEIDPHVRSWEVLVHPDDMAEVMKKLTDHLEGRTPFYEAEHRVRRKEGGWSWILDRGRVVERDDQGRPIRAVGAHIDISERKRLELERAKDASEQARYAQELEQFIALTSHELRSPLTALTTSLEWLDRSVVPMFRTGEDSQHSDSVSLLRRGLGIALQSGWSLDRLISDLLDLTRARRGKFRLAAPVRISVDALLARTLAGIQKEALDKEVVIRVERVTDTDFAYGDEDRLRQVLGNLLDNAVKFSPRGSTVFLRVSSKLGSGNSGAGAARHGDSILFEVRDQGPGLPADVLERIFERFWQAESILPKGLGLGLSIAREIVLAHGGRIWGENSEGGGAVFRFRLPQVSEVADPARSSGSETVEIPLPLHI